VLNIHVSSLAGLEEHSFLDEGSFLGIVGVLLALFKIVHGGSVEGFHFAFGRSEHGLVGVNNLLYFRVVISSGGSELVIDVTNNSGTNFNLFLS